MSESDTRTKLFTALHALAGIIPEMRAGQLLKAKAADRPGESALS